MTESEIDKYSISPARHNVMTSRGLQKTGLSWFSTKLSINSARFYFGRSYDENWVGDSYGMAFEAQGREVVKVGVEFDKNERNIGRWLVG